MAAGQTTIATTKNRRPTRLFRSSHPMVSRMLPLPCLQLEVVVMPVALVPIDASLELLIHKISLETPDSVNKTAAISMLSTPSSAAATCETPATADSTSAKSGKGIESSARKRLEFTSDGEQEQDDAPEDTLTNGDLDSESLIDDVDHAIAKSTVAKTKPAENKRARRGSSLIQKSG